MVDAVHFGQELVDYGIAYASSAAGGAALFGDRVQFVENDDVKIAQVAFLLILDVSSERMDAFNLLLGVCEEFTNIFLALTDEFV